jgi:DNA-directed RNA polymerase subunit RPC12/RpoP
MTTETLMVKCHRCGRAFPTPLQVDRATLEALVLTNEYECPHCGAEATYVKADHFHQLDTTEEPPGQG